MNLVFLAPQFLWALLALPLVLLLHFLRTRRRPKVVSALFLWRRARAAADSRRRFSATWLLLLQLLFAALAALALARPVISMQGPPDRVLIIDTSASMAAQDADGERMEKARSAAERILSGAGRVALLRAGLDAQVAAPLTADRAVLSSALRELQAADRSADLERALELARAIAPEAEVHVISDAPPPAGDFTYHGVAGEAVNYGITTFDIRLGQAYLAVTSSDPRPQQLGLALFDGERELARTTLLIPAGGQASVTFPVGDADGFVEARLEVPEGDALALDDVAYAGQRALDVVLGEESAPVIRALHALQGVTVLYSPEAPRVDAPVRVLFGYEDEVLPPGDNLLFSARHEDPVYRSVRDWDQADELLRFVDLRETVVGLDPQAELEEAEGWETLARTADLIPVISRRNEGGDTNIRVAFHPSQTDMVLRPAFPTFIANVISLFRGEAAVPLGAPLAGAESQQGEQARALEPGIYTTDEGTLAASLLSANETLLPGPAQSQPASAPAPARELATEVTRSLWLILVGLAAALLLLEWLAWSRGGSGWLRSG